MPPRAFTIDVDGEPMASVLTHIDPQIAGAQFKASSGYSFTLAPHFPLPSRYCHGCETARCGCWELTTPVPIRPVYFGRVPF